MLKRIVLAVSVEALVDNNSPQDFRDMDNDSAPKFILIWIQITACTWKSSVKTNGNPIITL